MKHMVEDQKNGCMTVRMRSGTLSLLDDFTIFLGLYFCFNYHTAVKSLKSRCKVLIKRVSISFNCTKNGYLKMSLKSHLPDDISNK